MLSKDHPNYSIQSEILGQSLIIINILCYFYALSNVSCAHWNKSNLALFTTDASGSLNGILCEKGKNTTFFQYCDVLFVVDWPLTD